MSDESNGRSVDSSGRTAIDPSKNVDSAIDAAIKRVDDLRDLAHKRQDDLRMADEKFVDEKFKHVEFVALLRAEYDIRLDIAETNRLNALRAGDESTRVVDREKAATQAALLATAVSTTADTLRALVASKADDAAKDLNQRLNPIIEKIASLERAQFTGIGERRAMDPAQAEMAADVKALLRAKEQSTGRAMISTPMLATIATLGGGVVVFIIERMFK